MSPLSNGPKPKNDLADAAKNAPETTAESIPHNKEALQNFLNKKFDNINPKTIKDFADKMSKSWSQQNNNDFCKQVLGLKIEGHSSAQINTFIKGLQEHLQKTFSKTAHLIKVDGKFGQRTAEALVAMISVQNGVEYGSGGIMVSVEDTIGLVKESDLKQCGKISNQQKRNEFFWTKVLGLNMPQGDSTQQADYIKTKIKDLQTYIRLKNNYDMASDGNVGSTTLTQFSKLVKEKSKDYPKVAVNPKVKPQSRFDDIIE